MKLHPFCIRNIRENIAKIRKQWLTLYQNAEYFKNLFFEVFFFFFFPTATLRLQVGNAPYSIITLSNIITHSRKQISPPWGQIFSIIICSVGIMIVSCLQAQDAHYLLVNYKKIWLWWLEIIPFSLLYKSTKFREVSMHSFLIAPLCLHYRYAIWMLKNGIFFFAQFLMQILSRICGLIRVMLLHAFSNLTSLTTIVTFLFDGLTHQTDALTVRFVGALPERPRGPPPPRDSSAVADLTQRCVRPPADAVG